MYCRTDSHNNEQQKNKNNVWIVKHILVYIYEGPDLFGLEKFIRNNFFEISLNFVCFWCFRVCFFGATPYQFDRAAPEHRTVVQNCSNPSCRQICFVRIWLTSLSTGLAQNLTGWYWYLSISIDTIGLNWLVHFEWIRVDWHRLQWTDAVLNRLAQLAWIGNRSHGSAPFWMDLQELASVWIGIGSNGLSRKRPVSVP